MDSCVSRVDSQRAKSPIPGVVEDKQFAERDGFLRLPSGFSASKVSDPGGGRGQAVCRERWIPASPEWILSEQSLRSRGWSRTSSLQREMDSCVSRVDSQRAKSPIPGVVE